MMKATRNASLKCHVTFFSGEAKRFEKPQPIQPWTSVYNATSVKFSCPQFGGTVAFDGPEGEQCLYLSVWRPTGDNANRPVLCFIYGGAFEGGTIFTSLYDGRYLAAEGAVVISINYRLGPLGFGGVPPNLGIHDQILALKFIRENVRYFGGNPDQITIFGESAGAVSIGTLLLSPLAIGLFSRAIAQSGSPLYILSKPLSQAIEETKLFAKNLNCPIDATLNGTMRCIAGKSVDELKKHRLSDAPVKPYLPVYGDEVLPLKPTVALQTGQFNRDVDFIYGVTENEVALALLPLLSVNNLTKPLTKQLLIKTITPFGASLANEVADYYIDRVANNASDNDFKLLVSQALGDLVMVCPSVLFGEELARHTNRTVYSYRLMQMPPEPYLPGVPQMPDWTKSAHGSDLYFLFAAQKAKLHSAADKLSRYMISSWVNYAKTGRPHSNWTEAVNQSESDFATRYMHLEAGHYKMVNNFYRETCDKFWKPRIF